MKSRDVDLVYEEDPSARKGLSDGEAWFGTPVWLARELEVGKVVAREIAGVVSGVFVVGPMRSETFGSREECEAVFSFRNAPVMFLSRYNEMSPDDPEVLGFALRNNPGLRAEDCL